MSHPARNVQSCFRPLREWAALGLLLLIPAGLSAHHSTAAFDMSNLSVKVHGKVADFRWMNPHSIILLDVTEGGETHRWTLEAEAVNLLRRNGWSKDTLKKGDEITCFGARAKDPKAYDMKCFTVEFADGHRLPATPLGVSGPPTDLR